MRPTGNEQQYPSLPPQFGGGGGGGGYRPRSCYKCGTEGHIARDCPTAPQQHMAPRQYQNHYPPAGGQPPPPHQYGAPPPQQPYQGGHYQQQGYPTRPPQPPSYYPPAPSPGTGYPTQPQGYAYPPPPQSMYVAPPPPVVVAKGPPRPLPAFKLITTSNDLLTACTAIAGCGVLSVEAHVSATHNEVSLLAIAPDDESCVYVIDVPAVTPAVVQKLLYPLLSDGDVITLMFNIQKTAASLIEGLHLTFGKPVDLQALALVLEWAQCGRNTVRPLDQTIERVLFMEVRPPGLDAVATELTERDIWDERPVTESRLQFAAYSVVHYMLLYRLMQRQGPKDAEAQAGKVKDARLVQYLQSKQRGTAVTDSLENMASICGEGGFCPSCRRQGHTKAECRGIEPPPPPMGAPGQYNPMDRGQCDACGKFGHQRDNCFTLNPEKAKTVVCTHCGMGGHTEARCFDKNPQLRGSIQCSHCNKHGHTINQCHDLFPDRKRAFVAGGGLGGGDPRGESDAKRRGL